MRLFICLFALVASGVAMISLPESWLQLTGSTSASVLVAWRNSVSLFVIPLVILVLRMLRPYIALIASAAWGTWIVIVSIRLLSRAPMEVPGATPYGILFIAFVLLCGLGTALFALTSFGKKSN